NALSGHQGGLRQVRRVLVPVFVRGVIMFGEAIAGASGELDDPDVAPAVYTPTEYRIKWTTLQWEADEAYKLRRAVFCIEQGIFVGDDRDEIDERAQQLVAVSCLAGMPEQVVGTVRIHE
ncbi:hypothetical protein QMO17_35765, partial [Klebsiella pneumoniae]|nr:hypothetical protein [Klebsiella pneumoniae]